jgi:antitoxin component YwqK of YwqJK toxin-antitoxin module
MKILLTIAVLFNAISAFACTCSVTMPFKNKDDLKPYDVIALVKITKLAPMDPQTGFHVRRDGAIGMEVKELFKGQSATMAFDQSFSSDCALSLHVGEQWLFFGNIYEGKILVGSCGYTIRYSDSNGMRGWWSGDNGPMSFLNKLRELYSHPLTSNVLGKIFYPNGNVEVEQSFKKGKLEGLRKIYYPSGQLYMIEKFKDGKRIEHRRSFFLSGQLFQDVEYKNSLIKKKIRYQYIGDGKPKNFSMHEIDLMLDPEKYPQEMKKRIDSLRTARTVIASITEYDKDGRSSNTKDYLSNQKLRWESYLDWGKQIYETTFYDDNGKVTSHSKYDKTADSVIEERYDSNNNRKETINKCGICSIYFDAAKPPEATAEKVYIQ